MKNILSLIYGLVLFSVGPFYFQAFAQDTIQIANPKPSVIVQPTQAPQGKIIRLQQDTPIPATQAPVQTQTNPAVPNNGLTFVDPNIVLGRRHMVGVGLGQAFLIGDYSDWGQDALAFDLYYNFKSSFMFQLVANLHAHKFTFNKESFTTKSFNIGVKAKIFDYDKFAPFFGGGFGFYFPSADRILSASSSNVTESGSQSVFGLNAFIGLDLDLSKRFSISFMSHLHKPFTASPEKQPDISGAYMKLLIVPYFKF